MRVISRSAQLGMLAALILTVQASPVFAGGTYEEHVVCEEKNCQVDLFMIRGFRAFSQCQVCHGIDGNGSSFAPSLNNRMQEIDRATFDDRVANGFKGQIGIMPPWKTNPNVMNYLDNLYAYLQARADQVIPPGRLQRYDRGEKVVIGGPPVAMSGMGGSEHIVVESPPDSTTSVFGSRGNLKQGQ